MLIKHNAMRTRPLIYTLLISFMLPAVQSCLREDPEPPVNADDGIYIQGEATAFLNFDVNGMMTEATNEATGQPGDGLYEIFLAVSSALEGFNVIEVIDRTQTIYGPLTENTIQLNGENGQISGTIQKGELGEEAGVFTVGESGLYHVIIDRSSKTFVISPVSALSLYNRPAGGQWSEVNLELISGFDKSNMIFEASDLALGECEFRFRYGHGDRIEVSGAGVSVNTSFGGDLTNSDPGFDLTMVPGGSNYILEAQYTGNYSTLVNWTVGSGFSAVMTENNTLEYPSQIFMVGDGISTYTGEDAWNWAMNEFPMIPVYSMPHLFWKIVWLNSDGGMLFAPQQGPEGQFGKEGDKVDGYFNIGSEQVPVPGTPGHHMVIVNLQTNQVYVSEPDVYLIGDAVGSWETENLDYKLTVDNAYRILTTLKEFYTGTLRMYAWHDGDWFGKWWNAEFNVSDGVIVFRGNRPHLDSYALDAGKYTVELNFSTGQGSVEPCDCGK
jgi:hypothetical protein